MYKTNKNWHRYRQIRNLVTKIKRKSIGQYFIDRCSGGTNNKDFWTTIKPFLPNKGTLVKKNTVLLENDNLITDQEQICNMFTDLYVNVAKDIGGYIYQI